MQKNERQVKDRFRFHANTVTQRDGLIVARTRESFITLRLRVKRFTISFSERFITRFKLTVSIESRIRSRMHTLPEM